MPVLCSCCWRFVSVNLTIMQEKFVRLSVWLSYLLCCMVMDLNRSIWVFGSQLRAPPNLAPHFFLWPAWGWLSCWQNSCPLGGNFASTKNVFSCYKSQVYDMPPSLNNRPSADQWKLAIKRGHGGRANLWSHDYTTTWPDLTITPLRFWSLDDNTI